MEPVRLQDYDRVLGKPKSMTDEQCVELRIRIETRELEGEHYRVMCSYWKPSAEELNALKAGASIEIGVLGIQHPPIMIGVKHVGEE